MIYCQWPDGCDNYCEGTTKYCSTHNRLSRKMKELATKEIKKPKAIPRRSQKMQIIMEEYNRRRPGFLNGKKCAVFNNLPATEIHHAHGREGYADEYARENDIPLILDERFWRAVSREGHEYIQNNYDWAIENGLLFNQTV